MQTSSDQYQLKDSKDSKNTSMTQLKQKYYKPATKSIGCLSSPFQIRFPQIQNSLITKGIFQAMRLFIKYRLEHQNKNIPKNQEQLERLLPINTNPQFNCPKDKIRYTWIGHSTAVISIEGMVNIIIDPVFSQRCSPIQCVGPKRFRDPACQVKDLPKIDLVLVSHDHYDHLDSKDLNELQDLFQPLFIAGLRSEDVFPNSAVKQKRFIGLDWTQTKSIFLNQQQYQITFVPACHWSKRGLYDTCKRLWGGFVIRTSKGHQIFYSGDTAYCEVFKEIGQIFGSFDLCILPIGAYLPRDLLKSQHFDPQDAVLAHIDLNSKKSVGVHWGTFPLGFEHWHAAKQDLQIAKTKHKLKSEQFITVGHGNSFQIEYLPNKAKQQKQKEF